MPTPRRKTLTIHAICCAFLGTTPTDPTLVSATILEHGGGGHDASSTVIDRLLVATADVIRSRT